MKARPIIFSAAMVQALLAGRKTQTRRVIKNPINKIHWGGEPKKLFADWALSYLKTFNEETGTVYFEVQSEVDDTTTCSTKCPFGGVGDLLWVREVWRVEKALDCDKPSEIEPHMPVDYAADGTEQNRHWNWMHPAFAGKWRTPLFMPRWASRLTLEITGVRVERVQDISEADAIAEGCRGYRMDTGLEWADMERWVEPEEEYAQLWDSLHGKDPAHAWAANPWVWVLEFKRVEGAGQ